MYIYFILKFSSSLENELYEEGESDYSDQNPKDSSDFRTRGRPVKNLKSKFVKGNTVEGIIHN